ncbi:MAG: alpha/beta fold hydrolase, partial [Burkholderiales bacterium]
MASILIGTHRIHYEFQGSRGAPVVVFVNGLTQYSSLWATYLTHFAGRGLRALSYDMPGQGQSSKPVLGMALEEQPALLGRLLDALEIARAHLAGISFGGVVALRFAIDHPERTASVAAMSTFSELTPQLRMLGTGLYQALLQGGLPLLQNLLLALNFSSRWLGEHWEALPEMKRAGYITNDLHAIQNLVESFVHFEPFTSELARIACPSLILNGERDCLTPRECHETLRRALPNSRLVLVQHACHAFTLEFPAITMRLLREFVESVENGAWNGDRSVWI